MHKEGKNFSITGSRIPTGVREFPFVKAVEMVLGRNKFVSIAFVSDTAIKKWNKAYRGKDSSTDILSFPSTEGGEILISLADARKKAAQYSLLPTAYLHFILIHGLLHLKGHTHGSKMEVQEKKLCKYFSITHPFNVIKNNSRNRHRNIRSPRSSSKT
jgi:rRNA maturation RNase YbeY